MDNDQIRAAGRVAGKMARNAGKEWIPAVRNSGKFVKHVVPAAVKPLHTLWHEVLGFVFLAVAGAVAFNMWKDSATTAFPLMVAAGFVVLIMAGYGISSILKAKRISRS